MCVGVEDDVCKFFSSTWVTSDFTTTVPQRSCNHKIVWLPVCNMVWIIHSFMDHSNIPKLPYSSKKTTKKNSRVKVCSQDFGSAIFFPHRSLPKLSKGAFEALKLPQQELQSGAHHPPVRLWVWGLCIVATSQRLRVPPTPWLLLSCATTSQYFVFSSGRLRGGLPHHCAGTAGFIKHLTSSRYLMVYLNQGAAGPHSRN